MGRPKIRWISFSFDDEFNPLICLTRRDNDQHEHRHEMFREAIESGSQSFAHQQAMESFNYYSLRDPHLRRIDRKEGPGGELIEELDLEIFVQLKSTDPGGLSLDPMKVWIVKISTMREKRLGHANSKRRIFVTVFSCIFILICFLLVVLLPPGLKP